MVKRKIRRERSINCALSLELEANSPYWSVIEYYQSLEKEKQRQLLLEAATGYWGAIALIEGTQIDGWQLKFYLEEGIYQLTQQIELLRERFAEFDLGECKKIEYLPSRVCEPIKFSFRYQVAIDTTEGKVAQYLMEPTTLFSKVQKVLWSSLAYWGAEADRSNGQMTPPQLSVSAANCICRLKRQIAYLKKCASLVPSHRTFKSLIHPEFLPTNEWSIPEGRRQRLESRRSMEKNSQLFEHHFSSRPEEAIQEEIEEEIDWRTQNSENDELILNTFDNL